MEGGWRKRLPTPERESTPAWAGEADVRPGHWGILLAQARAEVRAREWAALRGIPASVLPPGLARRKSRASDVCSLPTRMQPLCQPVSRRAQTIGRRL